MIKYRVLILLILACLACSNQSPITSPDNSKPLLLQFITTHPHEPTETITIKLENWNVGKPITIPSESSTITYSKGDLHYSISDTGSVGSITIEQHFPNHATVLPYFSFNHPDSKRRNLMSPQAWDSNKPDIMFNSGRFGFKKRKNSNTYVCNMQVHIRP